MECRQSSRTLGKRPSCCCMSAGLEGASVRARLSTFLLNRGSASIACNVAGSRRARAPGIVAVPCGRGESNGGSGWLACSFQPSSGMLRVGSRTCQAPSVTPNVEMAVGNGLLHVLCKAGLARSETATQASMGFPYPACGHAPEPTVVPLNRPTKLAMRCVADIPSGPTQGYFTRSGRVIAMNSNQRLPKLRDLPCNHQDIDLKVP
jgi:hypothetical protein